jgi:hypothetical protein
MINESFREFYQVHTEFLYTRIYENGFLFFDFWSLVHFWTGMAVFLLMSALNFRNKWFWFVFFIILYEALEVAFAFFALHIFRPERYNDLIIDILLGILAAVICHYILLYKSDGKKVVYLPAWPLMLFTSISFAFAWVGNYRYKYNYVFLNTKGINIGAFVLWLIFGFIFLTFYQAVFKKEPHILRRLILVWAAYFVLLLVVEYNGFIVMNWHEVSLPGAPPLIFGLIHGNIALHIYYMIFPFLIIPAYEFLLMLVYKAQRNIASKKFNY